MNGNLVWDAPKFAGEYNVAFIVEEWRFSELTGRYEQLGYVTRDMQIIVEDCDNERPELDIVVKAIPIKDGLTFDDAFRYCDANGFRLPNCMQIIEKKEKP